MAKTSKVRPLPFTPDECSGGRLKFGIINDMLVVGFAKMCNLQCVLYFMSKVGPHLTVEHFEECQEVFVQAEEESTLAPLMMKVPKNMSCQLTGQMSSDRCHVTGHVTGRGNGKIWTCLIRISQYPATGFLNTCLNFVIHQDFFILLPGYLTLAEVSEHLHCLQYVF